MNFLLKLVSISFVVFFSLTAVNAQDIQIRNNTGCDLLVFGQLSTTLTTPCVGCGNFSPILVPAGGQINAPTTATCSGVSTIGFMQASNPGAQAGFTQHPACGGAGQPSACSATASQIAATWIPINLTGAFLVVIE
mgnify:CR=1 FL=1